DSRLDDWLEVKLDRTGDISPYTLRLIATDDRDEESYRPFLGFDPRYTSVEFTFKPGCPAEIDCKPACVCAPEKLDGPEINYLAKDYASFRQLLLDRLALTMPDWRERHVPDLGIALVELLAYTGDYLSYYQDAVATEAYLETARKRISVRRHARLVDYILHEGCNARAWLFLEVTAETLSVQPDEIAFTTPIDPAHVDINRPMEASELSKLTSGSYEYFEPMGAMELHAAHNQIGFYTWGETQCCLPRGATLATLRDLWLPTAAPQTPAAAAPRGRAMADECEPPPNESSPPAWQLKLQAGDYLLFEELIGPATGNEADADPSHRQVVRLTRVTPLEDPLFRETVTGYDGDFGAPLLEIEWEPEDALPFPLCLSAIGPAEPAPRRKPCELIEGISVARGNIILVDHGRTTPQDPPFDKVPTDQSEACCEGEGRASEATITPGKFRPQLARAPLVFAEPLPRHAAASRLLGQDPRQAVPSVQLRATASEPNEWSPRLDLLSSTGEDAHFVVEIDDEGVAHLRFGDGDCGRMPEAGAEFIASYRVGGGAAGNVGADSITQIIWPNEWMTDAIAKVRNPLPARGGTAPEPIAEAKLFAPRAFRKELQRAIVAEDYAAIVMREFPVQVQRAGAELRWTGSWYSVRVAIDPRGSLEVAPALLKKIAHRLQRYRRMGHDLQVVPARYVPLEIELTVCLQAHYLRGHV
ncbi:MAG: putative baseplate assembly protein, partial [Verrucomicrobiota bacterium]|nr:putative baseplate assembly protein [Verrucomicrobiota bacterium]